MLLGSKRARNASEVIVVVDDSDGESAAAVAASGAAFAAGGAPPRDERAAASSSSSSSAAAAAASAAAGGGGAPSGDERAEAQAPARRADFGVLLANPRARLLPGGKLTAAAAPPAQASITSFFGGGGVGGGGRPPAPPLPAGVVLLPAFLGLDDCHALLAAVDAVSQSRPFEIPEVRRGARASDPGGKAFSNLYMTHAGAVWDGTSGRYAVRPAVVDADGQPRQTPRVPAVFFDVARRAVDAALAAQPRAFERPPFAAGEDAFAAILNFYPVAWGRLSVHADSSEPSLKDGKMWPVVSLSVGDAGVFTLYPTAISATELGDPIKLELRSGDVLLFGGAARLVRHEMEGVLPRAVRPKGLRMVPGRLNVTLRAL